MWLLGPVMIQQRSLGWCGGWGWDWGPGRARELSRELERREAGERSRVARSEYSGITYIIVLNRNPSRNPAITGSKDLSISRPPHSPNGVKITILLKFITILSCLFVYLHLFTSFVFLTNQEISLPTLHIYL